MADWSEGWGEEFDLVSNQLLEDGFSWPANEIEAFARVSARKAEHDSQPTSRWD